VGLLLLGRPLEATQPVSPQLLEEPGRLGEPLGSQPIQAAVAVAADVEETGLGEHPQVLGDRRAADEVLELIGPYDRSEQSYPMRSFDNQGNFATMTARVRDDGVWTFTGASERATLSIGDDGTTMTARWERSDDGSGWRHWMDMRFTKTS
jgi:hypothetical protein